jgi:hypothetical protein
MTRKHFILIAAAMNRALKDAIERHEDTTSLENAIGYLVAVFQDENSRFDRNRFRMACFRTIGE